LCRAWCSPASKRTARTPRRCIASVGGLTSASKARTSEAAASKVPVAFGRSEANPRGSNMAGVQRLAGRSIVERWCAARGGVRRGIAR
jgi:hypothetical protein